MDGETRQLRDALLHLSLPAAEQEEWLRDTSIWPLLDELGLDFDAAPAPTGRHDRTLTEALAKIAQQLDEMSEEPSLWAKEALLERHWDELRGLAGKALAAMDAEFAVRPGRPAYTSL